MPSAGAPRTAVERAMQECVGTIVVGAVGGAILGGVLGGGRNVARGAAIGGVAGTVACAALVAMANEEDKARILALERAAVAEGRDRTETYTREGVQRRISTRVYDQQLAALPPTATAGPKTAAKSTTKATKGGTSTAAAPATTASPGEKLCRYVETSVEVTGQGSATADKQLYCRTQQGDWEPATA